MDMATRKTIQSFCKQHENDSSLTAELYKQASQYQSLVNSRVAELKMSMRTTLDKNSVTISDYLEISDYSKECVKLGYIDLRLDDIKSKTVA